MRLGIDIDDVLADFIKSFRQIAHDTFGVDNTIVPNDWAFSNFNLSSEQMAVLWEKVRTTENFWKTLDTKPGTDLIREAEKAHEMFFITSRMACQGESLKDQTAWWLWERFDIDWPVVMLAREKGPIAKALHLDAFIDDRDKNCIEVAEALPNCRVFLKDAGHNQGFNRFPRVRNFDEFYREVTRGN